MNRQHRVMRTIADLTQRANQSTHTRIVTCGVLVVSIYLLVRLADLLLASLRGSAGMLLLAASGIGLHMLWQQRRNLQLLTVADEDRLTGYVLILSSAILYPFCLFAIWSQAIVALVALAGIACSCWGITVFKQYPFACFLIMFGWFPRTTWLAQILWTTFTPPRLLENFMAWAGSLGLRAIGQNALVEGRYIYLPQGAVEVAYGCNGLYMAATMAIAGLVLGVFLKQQGRTILVMMAIGALLALLFNIPRIMLMALAAVYWGEYWFDFWHSSWGGQIFVTVLFTIYYYAVMAIANRKQSPS